MYSVLVGLWDPASGQRLALDAPESQGRSYLMGSLHVTQDHGRIKAVRFVPTPEDSAKDPRWNPDKRAIDFGVARTAGALRCEKRADHLLVTPLPDTAGFSLTLDIEALTGRSRSVSMVEAIDSKHTVTGVRVFEQMGRTVRFRTHRSDFAYRVQFD